MGPGHLTYFPVYLPLKSGSIKGEADLATEMRDFILFNSIQFNFLYFAM